jgi:lipoprotein-anchoring transpeptidase ErfK/SrfK
MPRLALPALAGVLLLVMLATAASSATRSRLADDRREAEGSSPPAESPAPAAEAVPAASAPAPRPLRFAVARVRSRTPVALRAAPGGRTVARVGNTTEFGSARKLSVAERRGRWLGVETHLRANDKLAWVDSRGSELKLSNTRISLRADLSQRTLELRAGRRVVRRISVSVGRPGSSTPTGRFAVTDKLSGSRFGGYYGCCILALSGTQPNLPPGWSGGNRLAIHGTNAPGSIGQAASAGCLRAADAPLRTLMRRVPVGAPVFIRR